MNLCNSANLAISREFYENANFNFKNSLFMGHF